MNSRWLLLQKGYFEMTSWTKLSLSVTVVAGLAAAVATAPIAPAHAQPVSVVCPQASVVQTVAELLQANPDAGDEYIQALVAVFTDCPDSSSTIIDAVLSAGNADQIRGLGRAAAIAAIQLASTDPEKAEQIENQVADAGNELLSEAFQEESQTGQIEPGTGTAIPIIAPLTTGQTNDDPSPYVIRGKTDPEN